MSTIGHPLSDLANLTCPYLISDSPLSVGLSRGQPSFRQGQTPGLPRQEILMECYRKVAGWDPKPESTWGSAFVMFRTAVVHQGIKARYALRQASSARAGDFVVQINPTAEFAFSLIEQMQHGLEARL